jgi:two-component system sensor histidine kinase KdpD
VADYLHADCFAVYVTEHSDLRTLSEDEVQSLERHLNFARGLQIETRILEGTDVAETMVNFARIHGVTQIFVARERPSALRAWFASALVQRIVNLARDMQVTVVADRSIRHVAE